MSKPFLAWLGITLASFFLAMQPPNVSQATVTPNLHLKIDTSDILTSPSVLSLLDTILVKKAAIAEIKDVVDVNETLLSTQSNAIYKQNEIIKLKQGTNSIQYNGGRTVNTVAHNVQQNAKDGTYTSVGQNKYYLAERQY